MEAVFSSESLVTTYQTTERRSSQNTIYYCKNPDEAASTMMMAAVCPSERRGEITYQSHGAAITQKSAAV
jgi:hypothetical protein